MALFSSNLIDNKMNPYHTIINNPIVHGPYFPFYQNQTHIRIQFL